MHLLVDSTLTLRNFQNSQKNLVCFALYKKITNFAVAKINTKPIRTL